MLKIIASTNKEDFETIATLGSQIWHEHYIPIIGLKQVEYMLDKFQSEEAIENQIKNGYCYFTLFFKDKPAGYLSYIQKDRSLFLSKIYVLKEFRRMGFGKLMMNFVNEKTKELNLSSISLTVNKYNSNSILAYKKMGFENIDSIVTDIGGGFVMDDFVLEKNI